MKFRPWCKWVFYAGVPLLLLLTLATAKIKTDLSAFFIVGDNAQEIVLANEMQQGSLSRRYIMSLGSDQTIETNRDWLHDLKRRFEAIKGVSEVWQPGDQRFKSELLKSLPQLTTACLFSYKPETTLDDTFTELALQKRAEILKNALMSPQARYIKKIAKRDPLLLSLTGYQQLTGLINPAKQVQLNYKNLLLQTDKTGFDYPEQLRIQEQLQAIVTGYNEQHSLNIKLQMTGVPVFAVATQTLIEGDIKKVTIVSSILLTVLFLFLFRSPEALLQVSLLLVTSICSSILVTQAVFGYVHGLTLAIGTTLIGICIDYPIHALVHTRHVTPDRYVAVIAKIWPSMVLGGITTLIGYLALGFSGYPGFQQIAVYAGCGIPLALVITRFVMPLLSSASPKPTLHLNWAVVWLRHCQRYRLGWSILLLAAAIGAVFAIKNLQWMQDMEQLTPELHYLKHQDKAIRSRLSSRVEPGRFIMVSGVDIEKALQNAGQVYRLLDQLKSEGIIEDYYGLYPWLLSNQQQTINADAIGGRVNDETQHLWLTALQQQGLSQSLLELPDYSSCRHISLEDLKISPVYRLIENQILITQDQSVILIWIGDHQPVPLAKALDNLPGVHYFSQKDLLNKIVNEYRQQADLMLKLGLGFIFLLLLLRYKSLIAVWQTLMPSVLAALFILTGWSVTDQAISFLHLVGFLLAVAICVDYGIFFKENRGQDLSITYQAMAASMLTSGLVFGCLILAHTHALRTLGIVVSLGVVLGFLFCPIVIKHKIN